MSSTPFSSLLFTISFGISSFGKTDNHILLENLESGCVQKINEWKEKFGYASSQVKNNPILHRVQKWANCNYIVCDEF